jgi:hypothetical protein
LLLRYSTGYAHQAAEQRECHIFHGRSIAPSQQKIVKKGAIRDRIGFAETARQKNPGER